MTEQEFKAMPILEWRDDPDYPGYKLFRSDRKFYYASDIPDAHLAKVLALLERHEGGARPVVAYLGRPDREQLRGKWLVCVFRLPVRPTADLQTAELDYYLGMVDGLLIGGQKRETHCE